MIRNKANSKAGTSLALLPAFFFLAVCVARAEPAELRIDDLFSTKTITAEPHTLKEIDAAHVPQMLNDLDAQLVAGRPADVLQGTELLLAWLGPKTPEYARALYIRARAYDALADSQKLIAVAGIYLKSFPKGAERGWFLVRTARMLTEQGRTGDAAVMWKEIANKNLTVSPAEAIEGAGMLIGAGDGKLARGILDRAYPALDKTTENRFSDLRVEAMLVEFDAKAPTPANRADAPAPARLTHAMLVEMAGRRIEARREYEALQNDIGLSAAQRDLASERVDALKRDVWAAN